MLCCRDSARFAVLPIFLVLAGLSAASDANGTDDGEVAKMMTGLGIPADDPIWYRLEGRSTEEQREILTAYKVLVDAGVGKGDAALAVLIARDQARAAKIEAQEDNAENNFLGIDWSMGVSASFDTSSDSRVESAEVVDGIVRVEKESDIALGVVFDAHYFFALKKENGRAMIGAGPFVAIQTSGENLIDSFVLGGMVGFRRKPDKSTSFNLGVGMKAEQGVQVLGDGLEANQPLPDGESDVRFKKEDRFGVALVFSASF